MTSRARTSNFELCIMKDSLRLALPVAHLLENVHSRARLKFEKAR